MKINHRGILETSDLYFHTHSLQATKMYFYPLCTGHYYCDGNYVVNRKNYNSFLIMYICKGSGFVEERGEKYRLGEGDIAFIDCYDQHSYYTKSGWEFYWVHFNGPLAREYYEASTRNGVVSSPQNPSHVERALHVIFDHYHKKKKVNEVIISKYITDLLTEIILCANQIVVQESKSSIIVEILNHISENLHLDLPLDYLAKRASLSPYYFTRVFKKETGYTPHEYIVRVRLELAKYMLKTTNHGIKEIAFRSGFNNESSFCVSFKKSTGLSPLKFRREKV